MRLLLDVVYYSNNYYSIHCETWYVLFTLLLDFTKYLKVTKCCQIFDKLTFYKPLNVLNSEIQQVTLTVKDTSESHE